MSATAILDRLSRVKQTKPGAWMSACPCCESRKGRPLAVTETNDGRVLIHAFCGCSTADVLGRLGLELGDLFNEPLAPMLPPSPNRMSPTEVLNALSLEAATVLLIAADFLARKDMTEEVWQRLAQAAYRLGGAATYVNERGK